MLIRLRGCKTSLGRSRITVQSPCYIWLRRDLLKTLPDRDHQNDISFFDHFGSPFNFPFMSEEEVDDFIRWQFEIIGDINSGNKERFLASGADM